MAEFSAVNHTALVEIPVLVCRPLSVFSEPCVLLGWCWCWAGLVLGWCWAGVS